MSPGLNHIISTMFSGSCFGLIWLVIGIVILFSFFWPRYIAIKEQGFRCEGAAIDLNPDRYKLPASYTVSDGFSLEIRNSTVHTVRLSPQNPLSPVFSLQQPATNGLPSVPETHASEITLAAGQSGWLTFELGGEYDITVHSLDGASFLSDHLIVHVPARPMVVITDRGFLVAGVITDLYSASYSQPAQLSIKEDSLARFKNLSSQSVSLCLGHDGICDPQADGPEELRSGLPLEPGQSTGIPFPRSGKYNLTFFSSDRLPSTCSNLIIQVEKPSSD